MVSLHKPALLLLAALVAVPSLAGAAAEPWQPVVPGLPPQYYHTGVQTVATLSNVGIGAPVAVAGLVRIGLPTPEGMVRVTVPAVGVTSPCDAFLMASIECVANPLQTPLYVPGPALTTPLVTLYTGVLHLDANGDGFEDLSLPNAPTLSIQVPA